MKFLLIIAAVLVTSCSKPVRIPASLENVESNVGNIEIFQVGEIKISLLSVEKFKSLYGNAWVLMDGANQEGTQYAELTGNKTVPDARGAFLRMYNNGRNDGLQNPDEVKLGDYQIDDFKSHTHTYSDSGGSSRFRYNAAGGWEGTPNQQTGASGGKETRPKNITVNYFIKVRNCSLNETPCL